MSLDNFLTTKEAMKFCRVLSYQGFNSILKARGIEPVWRCGEGNLYRKSDFTDNSKPIDNKKDPFYEYADG